MAIYVGDRLAISTTTPFQDNEGQAFDPDVVKFTVTDPAGTTTEYSFDQDGTKDPAITQNGAGDYTLTIDADLPGVYQYRIQGIADAAPAENNRGAYQAFFEVQKVNT